MCKQRRKLVRTLPDGHICSIDTEIEFLEWLLPPPQSRCGFWEFKCTTLACFPHRYSNPSISAKIRSSEKCRDSLWEQIYLEKFLVAPFLLCTAIFYLFPSEACIMHNSGICLQTAFLTFGFCHFRILLIQSPVKIGDSWKCSYLHGGYS